MMLPSASVKAFYPNPNRQTGAYPAQNLPILSLDGAQRASATISSWTGYAVTPLVALQDLALKAGVEAIHYKHESSRFGLGSFKALGGAYAVLQLLLRLLREKHGDTVCEADILAGGYADDVASVTICCATDGNHGRSVAWGGRMFGCKVVIFIHTTVSEGRAEAIRAFGAQVIRTPGNYDDSVREAARMAAVEGWFVVSDTSYRGYTDVPRDVMQGYAVMAEEARLALEMPPSHIFVQGGVGGLAAAVVATFWEAMGAACPKIVVVEPVTAACLYESAKAGQPVTVDGELDTIMAGLACGEPSLIAWPILQGGADAFVALADEAAAETMRILATAEIDQALVAGESGVAGLAGFLGLDPEMRAALGITHASRILAFGSEGDTDADVYTAIVGQTGAALRAKGAI